MKITQWTKGLVAGLVAVVALAWGLTASGVVVWEVPFHGGMTKYGVLYSSDSAHLRQATPATAGMLLSTNGSSQPPSWVNGALGVGVGYRIARGQVVLDGSNPTPASHGLTTVNACVITNNRQVAPTGNNDPQFFTYATAATGVNINAWFYSATGSVVKPSTDNDDVVSWMCVGT